MLAHNRDDHSKNFSFLYNEEEKRWKLSPAYDLTYSSSIGGEHATTVNGNGFNPGKKEIMAVAENIGMNMKVADETYNQVCQGVEKCLQLSCQM